MLMLPVQFESCRLWDRVARFPPAFATFPPGLCVCKQHSVCQGPQHLCCWQTAKCLLRDFRSQP